MKTPNTQHTPGPWRVEELPIDPVYAAICNDRTCHDAVTIGGVDRRHPNYVANAALIAAAPDLLKALEDIASHNGVDWDWATTGNVARAAIAKAKGQP